MLSKRLQVLLDHKDYKKLKEIGEKTHKSVGAILREAARLYSEYLSSRSERLKIVEKLTSLKIPVSSWKSMEEKIAKAHLG